MGKVVSHKSESYTWKGRSASSKDPSQLRSHTARRCRGDCWNKPTRHSSYLDHSGLSDRRSLLRSTRFRSMAASGSVTARCTQPETVREKNLSSSRLSHGYLLLSLFPTCCNDVFFIPRLQNPSMFSFCVYRGCSVPL